MTDFLRPSLLALALVAFTASSAPAEQWKRPTSHGGEITREVTNDGRVYQGATTRTGVNGGTYSSSSTCIDGAVDRCRRSYSATGPQGKTVSGKSYLALGPDKGRQIGYFQGENGNRYAGVRRVWRR
ncbi:MAG: hypothetical protein NTV73_11705 [Hyphomicrobiales bacterium]|nr:hypothetical protein [Hyphomicrobiales bacterium]